MSCTNFCLMPTPAQAHCGSCHVTLGGVRAFDEHRRGGVCVEPASIGLAQDDRAVWRRPMSDEDRERFRAIS